MVKRIVGSDVKTLRLKGMSRTEWIDSVKRVLHEREMSVEQGRTIVRDKNEWRAVINA